MKKIIVLVILVILIAIGYVVFNKKPVDVKAPVTTSTNTTNTKGIAKPNVAGTPVSSVSNLPPTPVAISIKDFKFSSPTYTVKKGTLVTWTNNDGTAHTVTSSEDLSFRSATLSTGQSWSYTFMNVGTFDYHCTFHPTMKGTIIVTN